MSFRKWTFLRGRPLHRLESKTVAFFHTNFKRLKGVVPVVKFPWNLVMGQCLISAVSSEQARILTTLVQILSQIPGIGRILSCSGKSFGILEIWIFNNKIKLQDIKYNKTYYIIYWRIPNWIDIISYEKWGLRLFFIVLFIFCCKRVFNNFSG